MTIETFIVLMATLLLIVGAMIALTSDNPPPKDGRWRDRSRRETRPSDRQTRSNSR